MKCLETRKTPDGYKRRRYELDDGQRQTTIEIPMDLWNQIQKALKKQIAEMQKDVKQQAKQHTRKARKNALESAWFGKMR